MTTPINLNKLRKKRARQEARSRADTNAAKYGRTKAERVAEATRDAKAAAFLEARRFTEDE